MKKVLMSDVTYKLAENYIKWSEVSAEYSKHLQDKSVQENHSLYDEYFESKKGSDIRMFTIHEMAMQLGISSLEWHDAVNTLEGKG